MNLARLGFATVFSLALAAPACGGDEDDDAGTGGSSGKGGSSNGGKNTGSGGSSGSAGSKGTAGKG